MEWLPAALGLFAALVGGGGLVAFIKAKPEAGQIIVSAAQGAVVVQTGVINELRAELTRCKDNAEECKREVGRLRQIMQEAGFDTR